MEIKINLQVTLEGVMGIQDLEERLRHMIRDMRAVASVDVTVDHSFRNPIVFDGQRIPPGIEAVVFVEEANG
ncbi:MAG: hypothetical protein BroJett011_40680 [Chloroflexota bacterium]|nr:MAG: hypothetical protein BroJett011_40680 [Chloroflexota bacterium]